MLSSPYLSREKHCYSGSCLRASLLCQDTWSVPSASLCSFSHSNPRQKEIVRVRYNFSFCPEDALPLTGQDWKWGLGPTLRQILCAYFLGNPLSHKQQSRGPRVPAFQTGSLCWICFVLYVSPLCFLWHWTDRCILFFPWAGGGQDWGK